MKALETWEQQVALEARVVAEAGEMRGYYLRAKASHLALEEFVVA